MTVFEKGKVYKTVAGKPAKVLWLASEKSKLIYGLMCVVHGSYTERELILFHDRETGKYSDELLEYNLTTELYD